MMVLMNKAGFDLSCVGNHEFDGKLDAFRNVVNGSVFRHICANMYAHDSLRLHVEPYKIFEIDGIRIAVLGLLQTGANGIPDTHPENVKNLRFETPLQAATKYIWLRYLCDIFILLVHEEYDDSVQLANQYPFADILIGAHTHKRIEETELHNGVLITQSESHLKYVTQITVQLTDGKITKKEAGLLDVNAFSQKDTLIQAMVDEFNSNESFSRVLTQVITDFESYEELGYLLADAIRIETDADIAFQNPGGVRMGTFPKGPVIVRNVYQLDPFNNEIVAYHLTGEEVIRLIEAAYIAENKNPPYVSGISYEMELDKQGQVRKLQVKMDDGSRFNPQRIYKVVMNSYLAAVCQYEKTDPGKNTFRIGAELVIEYLEKQSAIDYKGVKRMTIKN
jgi:2',3'-cyclic-nucleotide 2'-phosphodiesterase (5'-nucleotidase family)